jgi:hypothetical protein
MCNSPELGYDVSFFFQILKSEVAFGILCLSLRNEDMFRVLK